MWPEALGGRSGVAVLDHMLSVSGSWSFFVAGPSPFTLESSEGQSWSEFFGTKMASRIGLPADFRGGGPKSAAIYQIKAF